MKIYLSGKITDNPDYREDFAKAQHKLEDLGFEVFNPAVTYHEGWGWLDYIIYDLQVLETCDAIYFLENAFTQLIDEEGRTVSTQWHSTGARIEYLVAEKLGLDMFSEQLFGRNGHT